MHKNILDALAEAERETVEMQRHLDRITGLLHAVSRSGDLKLWRLTMEVYQEERREMNRHSDLLNDKLNMLKEGKMKRSERMVFGAVIILLMVMLLVSVVGAQDTAQEATAVVVEAVTVVPTEEAGPIVTTEAPAATDEAPVEAPDPGVNYVREFMPYITQILIAVFIGVTIIAGAGIVVAGQGMPKWGRDILKAGVNQGFELATLSVSATPGEADDELLADLKKRVDEIFARMDRLPPLERTVGISVDIPTVATPDPWKEQYPADNVPRNEG